MAESTAVPSTDTNVTAGVASEPDGLRRIREQLLSQSPGGVAALLGLHPIEIEHGRVSFACETDERLANPMGTVHGGILATLLDSAMGCAAHTMLDTGFAFTTISLEVKYIRPVAIHAGTLHASAVVDHAGGRQVTARGTITDRRSRVVATATTTCLVLPQKG